MNNLEIYEKVRKVPEEAKRKISGGRLSGMTDINPMWRIKTLTEQFGPCGIGWYYDVVNKWTEKAGEEVAAFVDIEMYIKAGGEWSKPIHGTGGSMFVAKESKGIHISDECFKMAITDAISVACKQLGIGADVYWEKDVSKYKTEVDTGQSKQCDKPEITKEQTDALWAELKRTGISHKGLFANYGVNYAGELSKVQYGDAMAKLKAKPDKAVVEQQQAEQTAQAVDNMDDSGLPWK